MKFAAILTAQRAKAKLSQSQLAERAGISVRTLQGYEVGRREPRWSHVCALARGLGVPLTRFAL